MLRLLLHSYGKFGQRHPLRPAFWPHFDLLYLHAGRLEIGISNGAPLRLNSGEGVLIYPQTQFFGNVVGSSQAHASAQHFMLEEPVADENAVLHALAGQTNGFALIRGPGGQAVRRDVERAMELATQPQDERTIALRVAQLTLLIGAFSVGKPTKAPMQDGAESLRQIMRWAQVLGGKTSATEMARRAGYSGGHFRLLFTSNFKKSPAAFLLNLRINEAKRLLRESRKPIKELAREVGYGDSVAFHRAFRRNTGFTPASYRQRFAP